MNEVISILLLFDEGFDCWALNISVDLDSLIGELKNSQAALNESNFLNTIYFIFLFIKNIIYFF